MKHLMLFEDFSNYLEHPYTHLIDRYTKAYGTDNAAIDSMKKMFTNGKYLYHLTFKGNVKSIIKNGLIPRHKPNNDYDAGGHYSKCPPAVYLTPSNYPDSVNLPEKVARRKSSLVLLQVDVSGLDFYKFMPDDDFDINNKHMNIEREPWYEHTSHILTSDIYMSFNQLGKAAMSLCNWGAVAYPEVIPPELISIVTKK